METISPSALINVIEPQQYFGNSKEAERGRKEHTRIIGEMCSGVLPALLARAGVREVTKGKKLLVPVSDSLVLSSIPDALSDLGPIELKSGDKLQGKHLLQSAIECWVAERVIGKSGDGFVYLFDGKRLTILRGGGFSHRGEIGELAKIGSQLISYQDEIGTLNRRKGSDAIKIKYLANKAIKCRQESRFDDRARDLIKQLSQEAKN